MQAYNKIILNTLAQYVRTVINIVLSLYSARLVLDYLGSKDYGVYALVAGVVSMLSFFTNSLISSTQRFLSVNQGKGNIEKMKEVFTNSLLLHIVLGFLLFVLLESFSSFLFSGFLNIPKDRENSAEVVYQLVLCMIYVSFVTSPYRAILIARENIVYISIIDVLDGILKVLLVLLLPYFSMDKLVAYGIIILIVNSFNLFFFSLYSHLKYEECVIPKLKYLSWMYIRSLFAYTGWITYSSVCIAFRTQGLAIVLNKVLGPTINAAYGIGGQISGVVSFISTSFNNAIAPQLMAAEGSGNRSHMWLLAKLESKYAFLLLAMIGIPTIFEMKSLLQIWLVDVPPYTILFASMFLIMQIIDMLTTGLGLANRAIGKIGLYTVITNTPKILILPLSWILFKINMPVWSICLVMVIVEFICMFLRIPLLLKEIGFDAIDYIKDVFFKSIVPVLGCIITCFVICCFFDFNLRFILTFSLSIISFLYISYKFSLNQREKNKVKEILQKKISGSFDYNK